MMTFDSSILPLLLLLPFVGGLIAWQAERINQHAPRWIASVTMALFLGVALMQWVTGVAASIATAQGTDPYVAVMLTIAGMLAAGALAFRCLPAPAR